MSSSIFRKVSLERLSSPEELDRLFVVADSRAWIAQVAIFALLAAAIAWAYLGQLPSVVAGQGVVVRRGGVLNVVASGSGVITEFHAEVRQKIQANQIIATIYQPAILEKLRAAEEALAQVQRDQTVSHAIIQGESKLAVETIHRKHASIESQISHLEDRAELAKQQVSAQDQLFSWGIVTKEKTIEARQNLVSVEDQIAGLQIALKELDAEEFEAPGKVKQSDAAKQLRIQDLERSVREVKKELDIAENVVSPYGGEVLELKVSPGATIVAGDPVISIQPDVQDLNLLLYLPSAEAKAVKPGMEVAISPSAVKREEFGYIKGRVDRISDFPDTTAELMRNFENEELVKALTSVGPVTEIQVEIEKSAEKPGEYQWSTRKRPPLNLSSGTLCTAEIVTRWQKPVDLILPSLRKSLGLT